MGGTLNYHIMIQHYELMYVVPGSIEPEQVPTVKQAVADLIKAAGATVTSELDMERRRLAYKIGQQAYGYYHVVQFDIDASAVQELDKKLRLDNQLLRYLLSKSKNMSADELKTMIAGEKYKKQTPQAAAAADKTVTTSLSEAELAFAKSASSKHVEEATEEDKKVSIEELDKKLDAILEDTDIEKKL